MHRYKQVLDRLPLTLEQLKEHRLGKLTTALLKQESTATPGKLITSQINSTYPCQKNIGKLFLRVIANRAPYQHVTQSHLRFSSKDLRSVIRVNRHRYQLTFLILHHLILLISTIKYVFQFIFVLFFVVLWGRNKSDTTMYLTICFPVWTQSIPSFCSFYHSCQRYGFEHNEKMANIA